MSPFDNLMAPPTRLPEDPAAPRLAAADDPAVVEHGRELQPRRVHRGEGGAAVGQVLRVQGGERAVQQVADPGVRQRGPELQRGQAAEVGALRVVHDDAVALDGRHPAQHLGDGLVRAGRIRRVERDRLRLDPADRLVQVLQVHVLREDAEAAAAREGRRQALARHRVHVRRDDRDGRAGAVVRRQRDVQTARHVRSGRDEEHVGVGQVVAGRRSIELHGNNGIAPR